MFFAYPFLRGNKMINNQSPIAVFDSGMGGISVLKELYKLMPNENYIYFGDSINAPYGTKSTEEIRNLNARSQSVGTASRAFFIITKDVPQIKATRTRHIFPNMFLFIVIIQFFSKY